MSDQEIINWLLKGDVSIQYQTQRDLLQNKKNSLQKRIETEGWGAMFLSCRNVKGHWGKAFYSPKWTSTHYTLLDLKNLGIAPTNKLVKKSLQLIFKNEKGPDGGLRPIGLNKRSDVCLNGMALNYSAYFRVPEKDLKSLIDFILSEKMSDGGFNCQLHRKGAVHSSLHSTLSVLEGISEYEKNGYTYRLNELIAIKKTANEFILMHHLFRSDKTGEIIHPNFLKFYYPTRWYYDVLKAMDYFQATNTPYDKRMQEALEHIRSKRNKEGVWNLVSAHPGLRHFDMEQAGKASRWNTLRALRVLKYYGSQLLNT